MDAGLTGILLLMLYTSWFAETCLPIILPSLCALSVSVVIFVILLVATFTKGCKGHKDFIRCNICKQVKQEYKLFRYL